MAERTAKMTESRGLVVGRGRVYSIGAWLGPRVWGQRGACGSKRGVWGW
jgi:hypothetical protein